MYNGKYTTFFPEQWNKIIAITDELIIFLD